MSSRTLQRRIAEEDSSFRQLLSDARRELARVYLQHPSWDSARPPLSLVMMTPTPFSARSGCGKV